MSTAAVVVTLLGAVFVVASYAYLIRELLAADRKVRQWTAAHREVLTRLVRSEMDLAIARMVSNGELARMQREIDTQTRLKERS